MKTNKLCVNQQDYEHYLIPLPMNALFGKKRKSYLLSELEKMHPCFSDDFCFDTKLKFEKRHLFFDVVVISKMKLAEYRRKLKKYSAGVSFENLRRKGFFEKKYLNLGIVFLFLIIAFLFIESNFQREKAVTNENEIPEGPVFIAPQNQMKVNEFCEKILNVVLENGGTINNFSWKTDGYKEKINCEMENIFPEQFGSFVNESCFSEIKFINEVPKVSFSGEQKLANDNNVSEKKGENTEIYNCIRNVLENSGIQIISEKRNPYSISFIYSFETDVICELEKIFNIYNTGVSEINLSYTNEGKMNMNFTLCPDFSKANGFDMSLLIKFKKIFFSEYSGNKQANNGSKTSFLQNKNYEKEKVNSEYQKIGEVRYSNGRKVIFCKTENNKTIKIYE